MDSRPEAIESADALFRPVLLRLIPRPYFLVAALFALHVTIRFGGLWQAHFIPLSMAIIWPLPWLLSTRRGRRTMGLKAPSSWRWFLIGPLAALGVLTCCVAVAWGIFGESPANWFTRHALFLRAALGPVPAGTPLAIRFWIVTVPAMVFSPLAEEFLFRGFMLIGLSTRWGFRPALVIQAMAFALAHLAHYGLSPFQPALIAVWLPSMFLAGLVFGWMVHRSGSVWVGVVSHSVFNLGMNGIVFLLLAELVGP